MRHTFMRMNPIWLLAGGFQVIFALVVPGYRTTWVKFEKFTLVKAYDPF